MLRIAVPNKGSLSEDAVTLLREAGYRCRRGGRELIVRDQVNGVEFYFLRPRDIAVYVSSGVLDVGITGKDLALDSGATVEEVLGLNFGRSSFYYAVPRDSGLSVADFAGKRIATSYARIVEQDLTKRGIDATIIRLDGAIEISIQLGVADAIADVVESGRTLTEAGLVTIDEPILRSEAVLIAHDSPTRQKADVQLLEKRLQGIIVAREFVMVEYDIRKEKVEDAIAVTPGIESPTIAPLSSPDWVAVKAMANKSEVNAILDTLSHLGAKGIIVTDIRTCRL
jgi:ATP phosphoribosyltransferase